MVTAPRIDLYLGGQWIEADVRYEGPGGRSVLITRDRANEMSTFQPATCTFTLGNTDGRYSPRKPTGPYYGELIRGTPVRVARVVRSEAFGSDVADGWGADYTLSGGVAGDYDVAGGVGTISTGTAGTSYQVSVTGLSLLDSLSRADFAPIAVATVAPIRMGLTARYASASAHYAADLVFGTGGTASIQLIECTGGTDTVLATSTGTLAYDASTVVELEFAVEGGYLHAAARTVAEPATSVEVATTDIAHTTAGSCGVRVERDTGNTNGTLVLTVDDWSVEDLRFSGEVPAWAPTWDSTGTDSWVPITAKSVMERLSSGSREKLSAPRRWLEDQAGAPPVACWPLEEGTQASEGWPLYGRFGLKPWTGTHPSGAVVTAARFGRGELAPWLPDAYSWSASTGLSILAATVEMPDFVAADGWAVDLLINIPGDSAEIFIDVNPSYLGGSANWPQLTLDPVTNVVLVAMNGEPETSTTPTALYGGLAHHVRWYVYQDGANVSWTVSVDGTTIQTDTTAGAMTLPAITYLGLGSAAQDGTAAAIGYAAVWDGTPPTGGVSAYTGYNGELVETRLARLCAEEGVAYSPSLTQTATAAMGQQYVDVAGVLMQEPETADLGMLVDMRYARGVAYRTRNSMLNQTVALTLDYSAGVLSSIPVPVDDLSAVANDVTAKRPDGGTRRYRITDGPLGTADPADGGVGTQQRPVEPNVETDDQLDHVAQWVAHLGTVDAPRLPDITIELHRPEVAAIIDDVLDARTGYVVAITNPPTTFLAPETLSGIVLGSGEAWDQFEHKITFSLAPDAVQSNIGIWDDIDSRWDSEHTTLNSAFVAGTDTTMSVAVASGGVLWGGGGGFDVGAAGARVRVDAVGQVLNAGGFPAGAGGNVSDWAAQNGTIAYSTAVQYVTAWGSILVTPNGASASGGVIGAASFAVSASTSYFLQGWFYSPAGWSDLRPAVDWYTSADAYISSGLGSAFVVTAGEWTYLSQTVTSPGTAAKAIMRGRHGGTPANTDVWYVTALTCIPASTRTASPQTFTVAQTPVNGISKAVASGDQIRLWRPVRWAY